MSETHLLSGSHDTHARIFNIQEVKSLFDRTLTKEYVAIKTPLPEFKSTVEESFFNSWIDATWRGFRVCKDLLFDNSAVSVLIASHMRDVREYPLSESRTVNLLFATAELFRIYNQWEKTKPKGLIYQSVQVKGDLLIVVHTYPLVE